MVSCIGKILEPLPLLFLGKRSAVHKFAVGESVRVKDGERISESVQPANKRDGCLFMDQMWGYCGKTYKVSKVVDFFHSERKRENFRPRSPLYILEGLICEGKMSHFPFPCDRACPILWHEDWLDKV
ncbi:MAG: hypothetical protein JW753_07455 [Dehalococcoidia bacterium]|nr:hypothetical protein [Dehalococcoidia bacterium]